MVCFCFLVDQTRKVRQSKPAAGICSRCGGGASVADMKTATRFCYVPFYWRTWRAIMCTFCGAILRSYRVYCNGKIYMKEWVVVSESLGSLTWCRGYGLRALAQSISSQGHGPGPLGSRPGQKWFRAMFWAKCNRTLTSLDICTSRFGEPTVLAGSVIRQPWSGHD
ncbi:Unknown protein [Striga hermonthica]|uniref:Uncharacterized protein n=1 Tax=Striga hermonthica TaxID=68872 RepID=A0A9N7N2K9_STRHE|nr:Unknown protein [Striga hermonthica]